MRELRFSLILYVDDIELANPLGTDLQTYCSILVTSLPSQYRSSLHIIQLALLASDLQKHGYKNVLSPLLKDLLTLEQEAVFIETLGKCIKGSVLFVAADNLAAHGLGGFVQSFRAHHFYRVFVALQIRCRPQKFVKVNSPREQWSLMIFLWKKNVQGDNVNQV